MCIFLVYFMGNCFQTIYAKSFITEVAGFLEWHFCTCCVVSDTYQFRFFRIRTSTTWESTITFTMDINDISNFHDDTETVDILSRTVDSDLAVHLKTPDRSGVKLFNTNNTISEPPSSFKQLCGRYSIQIEAKQLYKIFKKENGWKHLVNVCKLVYNKNINNTYFCLAKSAVYYNPGNPANLGKPSEEQVTQVSWVLEPSLPSTQLSWVH